MERLLTIQDLLIQQVQNIHDGEKYIFKITPKILEHADYSELREYLMIQSEQKQRQLSRIGEVLKHLGVDNGDKKNDGVRALSSQKRSLLKQSESESMSDSIIAIHLRSMITLQVNAYQTAVSCAVELDDSDSIRLLRRCLREEKGLEKHLGLLEEICLEDLSNAPLVVHTEHDQRLL